MAAHQHRLRQLTGLRFVAAFAVFLLHARTLGMDPRWAAVVDPYLPVLCAGVTFFFVLSGFILAFNYFDELGTPSVGRAARFYYLRWARIYPVYLLSLGVSGAFVSWSHVWQAERARTIGKVLLDLTLMQGFAPPEALNHGFHPVAWSLSAEWFF